MKTQFNWKMKDLPGGDLVEKLVAETNYSPYFIQLCLQRNLTTKDEIEHFLSPDESWFHDPLSMHDMEKSVDRILLAIEKNEKITVYGDYDADGVTSTSIMIETLEMLGAEVDYYIPNRFTDGYGPNKEVFRQLIEKGTQIILTVDNGVAGNEAIEFAARQSVDVIVTDHHELPDELPNAFSIVHPKHPEGDYPFSDLSGAGVAFKLSHALLQEFPIEFLELAAIGTVADLVSLTDENRAIVKYGLESLKQTGRIGLLQLMRDVGLTPNEIDETSIGFKIGPILNAIGRLEDASIACELLTTFDDSRAKELSTYLIDKNEERKDIVKMIVEEAKEMLAEKKSDKPVVVLEKGNWHEGVLGIVASRIVKDTGKPTIILRKDSETGEAKGSARSIEAFNLFEACNEVRDLFLNFGGHHMAAGMTLLTENIEKLEEELSNKAYEIMKTTSFNQQLDIDLTVNVDDVSIESIREVNQLKPFGTGNPMPQVCLENITPKQSKKIGVEKNHLKMIAAEQDNSVDVIGFQFGSYADLLNDQTNVSLVGKLDINEWNGNQKSQLILEDIRVNSPIVLDKRTTQLTNQMFEIDNVHYICFQTKIYEIISTKISDQSSIQLIEDQNDTINTDKSSLVYVDCPPSIEVFKNIFLNNHEKETIFYFYTHYNIYLKGLPTREQFITLYKYLVSHQNLPIKGLNKKLSYYLGIDTVLLNLLLKMFLEANFGKIENGFLVVNKQQNKMNLTDTHVYQEYKKQLETEEFLLYNSFDELMSTLNNWIKSKKDEEKPK